MCASSVAAQDSNQKSALHDNAALQYWQAFSQMPALDEKREKLLGEWPTVSLDDPEVKKMLGESHSAMKFLRRGALCSDCDWGLEYGDGIGLLLPHLTKSRDLARLAALYTRNEYERGNRQALPQNATAMMVLARHVGRDPMMICLLVRYGIEGYVIDLAAPYVPEINVPYEKAVTMFDELPVAPKLRQSIAAEKKFFAEWIINEFRKAEEREPGAAVALWHQFLGPDGPQKLKEVDSYGQIMKMTATLPQMYDELESLAALPKPKFDAQYPEFRKRVTADNALVAFFLPNIEEIQAKEHRNEARMAMLLAAIGVSESGPERLKDIQDPFGDGPFEYRPLDKGYELRSKLLFEGKPVTLTVGRRKSA
jgi:hypothetical protein